MDISGSIRSSAEVSESVLLPTPAALAAPCVGFACCFCISNGTARLGYAVLPLMRKAYLLRRRHALPRFHVLFTARQRSPHDEYDCESKIRRVALGRSGDCGTLNRLSTQHVTASDVKRKFVQQPQPVTAFAQFSAHCTSPVRLTPAITIPGGCEASVPRLRVIGRARRDPAVY